MERGAGGLSLPYDGIRQFPYSSFNALNPTWLRYNAIESGRTCYGDSGGPNFLGGYDANLVSAVTITRDACASRPTWSTALTRRLAAPS